LYFKL